MVYGLDPLRTNADKLFNLMCLYGNVARVSDFKMLIIKSSVENYLLLIKYLSMNFMTESTMDLKFELNQALNFAINNNQTRFISSHF